MLSIKLLSKYLPKLWEWWCDLEWDSDKKYQQENKTWVKRPKSLTWKELFFRDKKAVLLNVVMPTSILLLAILI